MRVPLLDLKAQYESVRGDVDAAVARVVASQHFILGPEVEALEREIALYSRVRHAVGVSSGTDAILVALTALSVGPGDEVVTTPYTFIATCSCVARLGARAVFVDIDPRSYNVDVSRLEAAIGPRTKAIMPVHLFGQMAEMTALREISARRGVPIVEDAAQALGAELDGARAGAFGAAGTYSFFPSKNLGAFGDGGMIVTNDDDVADRLRLLRNQGQRPKYFSVEVGGNFRLDALQAAVLRGKLPHLDDWTAARQRNAARYRSLFAASGLAVSEGALEGGAVVALPVELPGRRHVYNQFALRVRDRDALRRHLADRGVGSEIYYPQPMHLQRCFERWGYGEGAFPESERAAEESLAIPIYPELTEEMQSFVVSAIAEFFRR
ncbi:MAG: DegT/DnrJ/EryC1/StrS family aminotransferase [Labilithrix sp.]|nr:DegT/DnrJ/EryC1/StrS family aminotransferase [Labilithrix sp.]